MVRPNYNLIRFIRRCISQMKKEYGGPITVYKLNDTTTNLETGVKTVDRDSKYVNRAVVLPNRLSRDVVQSISTISANKQVVQGGYYDVGTRWFIIDRRDVPGWELVQDDWIVYEGKRYDLKTIDEFEQSTAWLVQAREVERMVPQEDVYAAANSYMTLNSTSNYVLHSPVTYNLDVADALGISQDTLVNQVFSLVLQDIITFSQDGSSETTQEILQALGMTDAAVGSIGKQEAACGGLDWTSVGSADWPDYYSYVAANASQSGTDDVSTVDISGNGSGTSYDSVLANDASTIYMIPAGNETYGKKFDTSSDSSSNYGTFNTDFTKWRSGTLALNGHIYLIPSNATQVGRINTSNDNVTLFGTLNSNSNKWWGGVVAGNGNIYCSPLGAGHPLKITTSNDTATLLGAAPGSSNRFFGAVLGANGHVYCVPNFAEEVMKINTSNDAVTTFGGTLSGSSKWRGGVLASNNMIYCAPYDATTILKINTSNDSVTTFGSFTGTNKYIGGVLAPNGFVYFMPYSSSGKILKLDPSDDSTSEVSITDLVAWCSGGILAENGLIYGMPLDIATRDVLILDPDSDVAFCDQWCLSTYANGGI